MIGCITDRMRSRKFSYMLHKLMVALRLRCPSCEQGRMFDGMFRMTPICPYCHVRFERTSNEAIGGVYINLALAELTSVAGFFVTHWIFGPPIMLQLFIWIPYVLVFTLLFYRHARGLWVGVMFLMGEVYPDFDITQEYSAPEPITAGRKRPEHE